MNKIKIHRTRPWRISSYKEVGFSTTYILPSIEVHRDGAFEESMFWLDFYWIRFGFSIFFDRKGM